MRASRKAPRRRSLQTINESRCQPKPLERARKAKADVMMAKARHLVAIAERSRQPPDDLADAAGSLPKAAHSFVSMGKPSGGPTTSTRRRQLGKLPAISAHLGHRLRAICRQFLL